MVRFLRQTHRDKRRPQGLAGSSPARASRPDGEINPRAGLFSSDSFFEGSEDAVTSIRRKPLVQIQKTASTDSPSSILQAVISRLLRN